MENTEHAYLSKLYTQVRKVNQEKEKQSSKLRLLKNIEKKFKTAMIGTLARCEDKFGFLWGNGSDKQLTKEQRQFLELWQDLRIDILNHCNSQSRAALEEMSEYTISWNKYVTNFIIKK